ncbi:septum formation family protein [Spirillospora sp. NPDC046719]
MAGLQPVPGRRRTNRLAIVALLSGIAGLVVVAIGLAIAALVQAGRRDEKGRGLAVGALAVSAAWAVALTAIAVTSVLNTGHDGPEISATRNGKPRVTTLGAGACFTGYEEDLNQIYAAIAGCTLPHEGEVGAQITLPDRPYPGDPVLLAEATGLCKARNANLLNNRLHDHIELHVDRPRRSTWEHGDHRVTCVLRYTGSRELSTPLSHLQWGPRTREALAPGDCIDTWRDTETELTIDCGREHRFEVAAAFDMNPAYGPAYPREMKAVVAQGCGAELRKLYRSVADLPGGVSVHLTYPSKRQWGEGDRRIICLFQAISEPLRHSVIPG